MEITKYQFLSKEIFENLATNHAAHSVSIYIPTYKKGKEQREHLAQSNLKQCIKNVHAELKKYHLSENEIDSYLQPVEDLIANTELWRNPSDGLVIFLDKKEIRYYLLPISFETKIQVAGNFYLTPLLPLFYDDGLYYLLELSQDYVKLYEASKYGFNDLYIERFAPNKLEKAVGFDYKQKMIQFRSGQDAFSAGIFHGHGDGKDDNKKELFSFFREIDNVVNKEIENKNAPLLLACVEPIFNKYKEANTYPKLYDHYIVGDSEFKNKNKLHKESWKIIKGYFEKTKKDKLNQFAELYHTPKISYQVSEIIPAAINGKIDTLFIEKNTDVFGIYNAEKRKLILNDKKELNNGSLTNLSSINTFLKGGKVYVLDPPEMPIEGESLNAIFRY